MGCSPTTSSPRSAATGSRAGAFAATVVSRTVVYAAHHLAVEIAKAGGEETDRVEFARSELDRFAASRRD